MAPGPPRIASFLQCKTSRGLIIPCKNAGILFRESSAEERSDDGAEKREERREKRDGSVPEGQDGREKGWALGETREERKKKREDPCRNNEQLQQGLHFPGSSSSERSEKREERRDHKKGRQRSPN